MSKKSKPNPLVRVGFVDKHQFQLWHENHALTAIVCRSKSGYCTKPVAVLDIGSLEARDSLREWFHMTMWPDCHNIEQSRRIADRIIEALGRAG